MSFRKYGLAAIVFAVVASSAAFAAGLYTNGLPLIGAPTQNGVVQTAPNGIYTNLTARTSLIPIDTNLASGMAPQTVAASSFDVAALAAGLIKNQQTSTVHAATSNTNDVLVTTEALTTAVAATYTFTLTDSLVTLAGAPVLVQVHDGTNTTPGLVVTSVTNAAGSVVVVLTNNGSAALNGTILLAFHV